nr:hypothetical protein GCM10020093_087950 [Planobispora longispora]
MAGQGEPVGADMGAEAGTGRGVLLDHPGEGRVEVVREGAVAGEEAPWEAGMIVIIPQEAQCLPSEAYLPMLWKKPWPNETTGKRPAATAVLFPADTAG